MDIATILFFVVMVGGGATLTTYLSNRSRCTLEEAAQRSGCTEKELQDLIQAKYLEYRRQFVLFGPQSLNVHDIAGARAAAAEIKRIQADTEATIRKMAEETAAHIQEINRRAQEREAAHQAYMEMLDRVYTEVRKNMKIQLMPPDVVDAFRILGLPTDTPFREVYRRYRQLAKQHHPDAGGNPQAFIGVNKAYTCIENWIKSDV